MRRLMLLVAWLASTAAFAARVNKPEVIIDLPDGWVEVPAEVLTQFHAEMKRQAPLAQIPKYDYAFQSANGPPWLAYPYLLVKITPSGRPTEHDLESLPSIDLNEKFKDQTQNWSNLMKDTSLGKMRYDKAANVVWIPSKSNVNGIGVVSGISGIIPTEKGFVELHAYSKTEDFEGHMPTFDKVITGAKVAPELLYQPRWSDKLGPAAGLFDTKSMLSKLAIFAIVGVLIAVFLSRRRKQN